MMERENRMKKVAMNDQTVVGNFRVLGLIAVVLTAALARGESKVVTNTGKLDGRCVVQCYTTKPKQPAAEIEFAFEPFGILLLEVQ